MPLWYLQQVERVRTDVTVINLPSTNVGWYLAELRRHDPDLAGLLPAERQFGLIEPANAADSTATIPVDARADLGLAPGAARPESVAFRLQGPRYGSDRVVLDLLRISRWRRPVFLASTVPQGSFPWLEPYARLDGLSQRIMPTTDATAWDVEHLRHELIEVARYQGAADSTLPLTVEQRAFSTNYAAALFTLASAQLSRRDARGCLESLRFIETHVRRDILEQLGNPIAPIRASTTAQLAAETPRPRL